MNTDIPNDLVAELAELGKRFVRNQHAGLSFLSYADRELIIRLLPHLTPAASLSSLVDQVHAQFRFVQDNEEQLLRAWMAQTGLLPSESLLVHHQTAMGLDGAVTMSCHVERLKKDEGK